MRMLVLLLVAFIWTVEGSEENLLFGLITPTCFEAYVTRYEWNNIECFKAVVSKGLSYAIIGGSLILKLPQIIKIIQAKDCTGLRPTSFYLEVVLYLSSTIYNVLKGYPISTWGEMAIVLIQNIILVILIWMYYYIPHKHQEKETIGWKTQVVLTLTFFLMAAGMMITPPEHQWLLASAGIPVSIVARIPQVIANFQQGHTGQLAFITLVLNFAGSLARLFTTLQETGDVVQLAGYGVGSALNGMLVLQVLIYWKATNKALAQTAKEQATKKKAQ